MGRHAAPCPKVADITALDPPGLPSVGGRQEVTLRAARGEYVSKQVLVRKYAARDTSILSYLLTAVLAVPRGRPVRRSS